MKRRSSSAAPPWPEGSSCRPPPAPPLLGSASSRLPKPLPALGRPRTRREPAVHPAASREGAIRPATDPRNARCAALRAAPRTAERTVPLPRRATLAGTTCAGHPKARARVFFWCAETPETEPREMAAMLFIETSSLGRVDLPEVREQPVRVPLDRLGVVDRVVRIRVLERRPGRPRPRAHAHRGVPMSSRGSRDGDRHPITRARAHA